MRDVMRRYRQKGGATKRVIIDDGNITVRFYKARAAKGVKKHRGQWGEVVAGCGCLECQAAGMAPPAAPRPTTESELRAAAKAKLEKLKVAAFDAVMDAKYAMTHTVLRRRDGSRVERRRHNDTSRKLRTRAKHMVTRFKTAEFEFAATFGA